MYVSTGNYKIIKKDQILNSLPRIKFTNKCRKKCSSYLYFPSRLKAMHVRNYLYMNAGCRDSNLSRRYPILFLGALYLYELHTIPTGLVRKSL